MRQDVFVIDFPHMRAGGQHGDNRVCVLDRLGHASGRMRPGSDNLLHGGFRKVERQHLAPADNLPRSHAAAHIAKADECDAGHDENS